MILTKISAWLHDIGFTVSHHDHELKSAEIAVAFLREKELDADKIKLVENAILATRIPQEPKDEISKVLCDADMYHITTDEYFEQANLMRKETKAIKMIDITKVEFERLSYIFFNQHFFHTNYGKTVLQEKKEKTMELLVQKIG